jgi:hypothetical protein
MISYAAFGALRLKDFVNVPVTTLENWEFMDKEWVGEALGFSEWLRLQSDPATLRSLALDFEGFPAASSTRVLAVLGLRLRGGMTLDQLRQVLGEPLEVVAFVPDRTTYEFATGGEDPFNVSCTVRSDTGLSYVLVSRPSDTQVP